MVTTDVKTATKVEVSSNNSTAQRMGAVNRRRQFMTYVHFG